MRSKSTVVRELLEQDLLTGVFSPGEKLDEAALAERFEVSRTPIREALKQLAAADLVDLHVNRGAFVKTPSVAEALALFEVMAELEGVCARLAAHRGTDEQFQELSDIQAGCAEAIASGDADTYYYLNAQFHQCLYEASGNPMLARTARSLQLQLAPFRRLQLRAPGRLAASASEHDGTVAALRARDAQKAESLIREHVTVQVDSFIDFLISSPAGSSHLGTWEGIRADRIGGSMHVLGGDRRGRGSAQGAAR